MTEQRLGILGGMGRAAPPGGGGGWLPPYAKSALNCSAISS